MASGADPSAGLPDDLKSDKRDVADLWKEALKSYKGIVGFDLEQKFENVDAMIAKGTQEMNNFHKFRHNDKKVDKLRTLFATNLDYLEKGAQQLISAATPAFPPAAAIGTAVTYMLTACRQVSADYDIVVVFFEDMNSFLQRIVILETRLPKYKAYQNCLMDVFTSFLTMCGFAHKYIELGRFKKWISNLLQGEDSELGGARKNMDLKLSRLQSATEFAILGNTEELQNMSVELKTNQDAHTAMLEQQMEVMGTIRDTTETIRNDMAKLLKAFEEEKKNRNKDQRSKVSAADQIKPASAKRIRNVLMTVQGDEHEYHILKETMVADTCTWVFSAPEWDQWFNQEPGLQLPLAITGDPGSGKSHVGAAVYERLQKEAQQDSSKQTCAAHFYFREQSSSLSSFLSAIITVINQVVEQSSPVCEIINTEYLKDEVSIDLISWQELLKKLLGPAFRKDGKNRLWLMLDGLDELDSLSSFTEFLKILKDEGLRISVAFTGRATVLPSVTQVTPTIDIEVKKEKQAEDFKALVWDRLSTLDHLRTFGRYVKQRVADKIEEVSPNMLYAEHMLIRLNSLRSEGAVLRRLDQPLPVDLHELYETLLDECHRRTGTSHQQLVIKLLHWLAFSFRPFTLNEVQSLLKLWAQDEKFDIEEIPEPFAKFIRVGDPGVDAEAVAKVSSKEAYNVAVSELDKDHDSMDPRVVYNDGVLPVKFMERSMRGFFREDPKQNGSLRWRASEAQRQMFLDTAKLARPRPVGTMLVDTGVKIYTVHNVFRHWALIEPEQHSLEEQAEVMEAFGIILSNKQDFAIMAEWQKVDYKKNFTDKTFERISQWAKLLDTDAKQHLSEPTVEWWTGLAENPRKCFLQLALGHGQRIYAAADLKAATFSFKAVRQALELSHMEDMLATQAKKNFKSAFGHYDRKVPLTDEQAVLGLEDVLPNVKMGVNAYRAVAMLLLSQKHKKPAEATCKKAIELSEKPLDKVKSLELMTRIYLKKDDTENATTNILSCMENLDDATVPASLKRTVLLTKAKAETEADDFKAAAESYSRARAIDPANLISGKFLDEEISLFIDEEGKKGYIDVLKKWSPLERVNWMAWDYEDSSSDDRHAALRDAALESGETDFVLGIYEEAIRYLDNVNAAAPLRNDLARFHLEVTGDLEQARKVLDETLDSSSTGWPYAVTDEYPATTLETAIYAQTDVLNRLFLQSTDPVFKAELFEALKGLLNRPLALDVPPESDTYIFQRRIVMARMYLKMGPSAEFQSTLQGIINTCIQGLSDSVGWNDSYQLIFLAAALNILAGAVPDNAKLVKTARILISAQFSRLDPTSTRSDADDGDSAGSEYSGSESGGDDSDSESSDGEEEEAPTDEGDLDDPYNVELSCRGNCNPNNYFSWWKGRVTYQCVTCNAFLCEPCYERRQADNRGEEPIKGRQFCGRNHSYIKGPIEGWKGVKDGKVMLEGEEPVEFKEILRQIGNELCKEAWESFWRG
ncbi:hypothetical protein EDB81DRAFT_693393 [Dactylonectria macrodidyma]|uniref:Fungal STAND N-terminal Goodbye domain-containing protein n=1 Tax=Dactylonectria macrodidyma TaxID=307937 RepID=A0A9P9EBN9_9HYPO|nr:hypothetical protein EDB81DRAFT_693393 [Dactylonectria macrodidyma]